MSQNQKQANMEELTQGRSVRRVIGKVIGAVLSVAVLVGLYFTLVIAQPQTDAEKRTEDQPLLSASPEQNIAQEADLRDLVHAFPVPVMSFMSGSGMIFVSGNSVDIPYEGKYGRRLSLYWQTPNGDPMILESIYPAAALEIMGKGDFVFSGTAGPTLFGQTSVKMENGEAIRLHVQMEGQGLYVVTVPRTLAGELSSLCRSIQLFTAD